MADIFTELFGSKLDAQTVFTPQKIAIEMLEALPLEVWNRHTKFLDPCCKSGIFLKEIRRKLLTSPDLIEAFPDEYERAEHIDQTQLYGIAMNTNCLLLSTRNAYGRLMPISNIRYIESYQSCLKDRGVRATIERIEKEFSGVTFDVVIGNPPYNKGADLDFVNLAYDLSSRYVSMITPAKWQTAEADQKIASNISYGEFRKKIVPKMTQVTFYPQCTDAFDISNVDGITSYTIDKKHTGSCTVTNICANQKYFNSTEVRDITNGETLNNIGNKICRYIANTVKYTSDFDYTKKYVVLISKMPSTARGQKGVYQAKGMVSHATGKMVIIQTPIITTQNKISDYSDTLEIHFSSDNRDECESFVSWMYSKLTRFMIGIYLGKQSGIASKQSMRFVPAPPSGKFDHIYTDQELYEAFNLPQKYIDVIEAVIKER